MTLDIAGFGHTALRSIDRHNLRYTTYVGDGDSSAFGTVKEAVTAKFGDDYPLVKEDCIGHIQKRMGTALRTYKNVMTTSKAKLSDGKGVGGVGRLTDAKIDLIQTYYGYAIRNNKHDEILIQNAIWAIFYHMIVGPESESLDNQHQYCPKGSDSWCKYQLDLVNGTSRYDRAKCIPSIFREELKPIFDRLSSSELLNSCKAGLTQNQNESINSVMWTYCPKKLFCGIHRFTLGACDAISQFNDGSRGRYNLFKSLNVSVGDNAKRGLKREQKNRLRAAAQKVSKKYKRARQDLRQKRKSKKKKDKSYKTGSFSTGTKPDQFFPVKKVSKTNKNETKQTKNVVECSNAKKSSTGKSKSSSERAKVSTDTDCEICFVHDSDVLSMIKTVVS